MALENRKKRTDRLWLGVEVGLGVPLLALAVMILVIYSRLLGDENLLAYLFGEGIPSRMLSLATLCNLLPFLLSVYTDRYFTARGILGVTVILAILSVTLRLVF
ncbi:MAG: hypothetical protein ACTTKZ_04085 [Bacteroides sp.]